MILFTEAWLLQNHYNNDSILEPLIALVIPLVTFLAIEYKDQVYIEPADKKLFHEFRKDLQFERSISFIDCHDMSEGPFDPDKLSDLYYFIDHWNNASHEFNHKGIEKRKKILYELIESFLTDIDEYTVITEENKREVSPELNQRDPDTWREVINEFHSKCGMIVLTHQDFMRYSKHK